MSNICASCAKTRRTPTHHDTQKQDVLEVPARFVKLLTNFSNTQPKTSQPLNLNPKYIKLLLSTAAQPPHARTDGNTDRRKDGPWMEERADGKAGERKVKDGRKDIWKDRWVDNWTNKWMVMEACGRVCVCGCVRVRVCGCVGVWALVCVCVCFPA